MTEELISKIVKSALLMALWLAFAFAFRALAPFAGSSPETGFQVGAFIGGLLVVMGLIVLVTE